MYSLNLKKMGKKIPDRTKVYLKGWQRNYEKWPNTKKIEHKNVECNVTIVLKQKKIRFAFEVREKEQKIERWIDSGRQEDTVNERADWFDGCVHCNSHDY